MAVKLKKNKKKGTISRIIFLTNKGGDNDFSSKVFLKC